MVRFRHVHRFVLIGAFPALLAGPSMADPAVGVGISLVFGGGSVETGLGLRVFSDDEENQVVASVGLDYMFGSQRLRPTLGAAYLDQDFYVGLDLGYDFAAQGIDYGIGFGLTDTTSETSPAPADSPVPAPEPGPTPTPEPGPTPTPEPGPVPSPETTPPPSPEPEPGPTLESESFLTSVNL